MWILLKENKLFENRKQVKDYLGGNFQFNKHFYQNKDVVFLTQDVIEQIKNR